LNGAQSSAPPRSESNSQSKKTSTPGPLEFATQIPLQARYARCKLELKHLVYHKRDHNAADMKEKALLGSVLAEGNKPIQPRMVESQNTKALPWAKTKPMQPKTKCPEGILLGCPLLEH